MRERRAAGIAKTAVVRDQPGNDLPYKDPAGFGCCAYGGTGAPSLLSEIDILDTHSGDLREAAKCAIDRVYRLLPSPRSILLRSCSASLRESIMPT
jgi:hypothetical protein